MQTTIPKKYVNDFIVYLQKTYDLYSVQFRQESDGKMSMVLGDNITLSNIWVSITDFDLVKVSVQFKAIHQLKSYEDRIANDIVTGHYKGFASRRLGELINKCKLYTHGDD